MLSSRFMTYLIAEIYSFNKETRRPLSGSSQSDGGYGSDPVKERKNSWTMGLQAPTGVLKSVRANFQNLMLDYVLADINEPKWMFELHLLCVIGSICVFVIGAVRTLNQIVAIFDWKCRLVDGDKGKNNGNSPRQPKWSRDKVHWEKEEGGNISYA